MQKLLFIIMFSLGMVSCAQNRDANNVEKRDSLKFDIKGKNADKEMACYEQSPSFRGGDKAFLEYVQQHIQYPRSAYVRGVEGRVIVGCFVEKDGSLNEVHIVHSIDSLLDKEAIRVVKNMPRWNPGTLDGEAIRMNCAIPIHFKINQYSKKNTQP